MPRLLREPEEGPSSPTEGLAEGRALRAEDEGEKGSEAPSSSTRAGALLPPLPWAPLLPRDTIAKR